jgi:hypothetical protein
MAAKLCLRKMHLAEILFAHFSPAICSKCVNITEQISLGKDAHNETLSHFQKRAATLFATDPTETEIYDTPLYNQTVIPPNGLPTNMLFLANSIWEPSSRSFETSVDFPSDITWALNSLPQQGVDWTPGTFLGIENPILAFARISLEWDPDDKGAKISEALECVVTLCVNEYSTSIEGTQLHENVLSTTYGSTWRDNNFRLLWSATVQGVQPAGPLDVPRLAEFFAPPLVIIAPQGSLTLLATPLRCMPMRYMSIRCIPMRYTPMRCMAIKVYASKMHVYRYLV